MTDFDDSRLDDQVVLGSYDQQLRELALQGARVRSEAAQASDLGVLGDLRPRGIIAVGGEARLVRAVLEPVCPVPFVAWQLAGVPGWVGSLDLMVVLASSASEAADPGLLSTVAEARKRGTALLVAAPAGSAVARAASSSATWLLPTRTPDPFASAVVVLRALHELGLGPAVQPDHVAEAADMVAETCSPFRDLASNPGKDLALNLAEAQPLIWGGSVLAARASRRIAEAIRDASGRVALAADAVALEPVLARVGRPDLFADPFDAPEAMRPVLLMLDDHLAADDQTAAGRRLERLAGAHQVRVCHLDAGSGDDVDRYVTLLQTGRYAARYLGIALGVPADEDEQNPWSEPNR